MANEVTSSRKENLSKRNFINVIFHQGSLFSSLLHLATEIHTKQAIKSKQTQTREEQKEIQAEVYTLPIINVKEDIRVTIGCKIPFPATVFFHAPTQALCSCALISLFFPFSVVSLLFLQRIRIKTPLFKILNFYFILVLEILQKGENVAL